MGVHTHTHNTPTVYMYVITYSMAMRRPALVTHGRQEPVALHSCHMSTSLPPAGYDLEQVVRDGDSSALRVRRADERTSASAAAAHERFIIAAPIGVCIPLEPLERHSNHTPTAFT